MKIITLISRYLLALMLLVFGLNKFLQFMPAPDLPASAMGYMGGLASTGVIFPLLGIIYILTGVSLILDKFAPLMLLILAPVCVNILIFHATLAPGGILMGAIMTVLAIIMMFAYKDRYAGCLKA